MTSSLIYKMKVENLFYDEVKTSRKRVSELAEPVEVLKMPFRLQPPISDISDLVSALQNLLLEIEGKPGMSERERNPFLTGVQPPEIEVDTLTTFLEDYKGSILERLRMSGQLKFVGGLAAGKDWKEVVRLFIAVLFLAHQQKLVVTQEEDSGEMTLVSVG